MRKECYLVQDLLPLYEEDMTSKETAEYIEEHLESCEECRKEHECIRKPVETAEDIDAKPLKNLQKMIRKKKSSAVICAVLLVLALAVSVFALITAPEYLAYSENSVSAQANQDGSITVSLPEGTADYSCTEEITESGLIIYNIEAWTSMLDRWVASSEKRSVTITPESEEKLVVYYIQNNEEDDVRLYTNTEPDFAGRITLRSMRFAFYLFIASAALAVLIVLRLIYRKNERAKQRIERLALIPAAYIAGQMMAMCFRLETYSPQRDFALTMLTAILVYCGLICGYNALKLRKEIRETAE